MRGASRFLASDLRSLFGFGALGGLTDGELLDRAVIRGGSDARRAEAAFEALVMRHGPMVLRVCRLHLRDASDVEDAFQATFLVFARRQGSIRRRESVASWLHGVASRVAARARVEAARRNRVERASAETEDEFPAKSESADKAFDRREIDALVQEEVRRLPGRYREVIVLCFWEGLTQEQAAQRLGCPVGTVRSRSARARDLLRTRLTRRGLAPASVIAASMLGRDSAFGLAVSSHVPVALVRSAVRACVAVSSGVSLRAAASGSVLFLTENFLRSVLMIKIKTVSLAAAVTGLGFLAAGKAAQEIETRRYFPRVPVRVQELQPDARKKAEQPKPKVGKQAPPDYIVEAPDLLVVEVLDALPGRPITGERLVRPDGRISLGFYGDVYVAGLTLAEVKEKVVRQLRKQIGDKALGLDEQDRDNEELLKVAPKDSDRVYVDVAAYNSKRYYVQGDVIVPGRFPVTGNDNVLDAINYAGGLTPTADKQNIRLIRPAPPGGCCEQVLPVDLPAILNGDSKTNYQLQNGDRLIVYRDPKMTKEKVQTLQDQDNAKLLRDLEHRLNGLEGQIQSLDKKLDRVLERLGGQ
jgi:RNA polymerase sigma factor (sigma-70 family)